MSVPRPEKPFSNYKWRWATFQPTESLNEPPIFLGVLRVFNKFKNHAPGSPEILAGLEKVQEETNSHVDLVRTRERNLVRNSGQYWKAFGLLEEAHGKIIVSTFGEYLASGRITQVEFASTVIKTLELPNPRITDDTSEWEQANLKIKPLELILDIISKLGTHHVDQAFITPEELVRIIIPLAGAKAPIDIHAQAILEYRIHTLDVSAWPDCAPSSNDKRMAREFLLFLANYGFCHKVAARINADERYFLGNISREEIAELHRVIPPSRELVQVVRTIRETQIPANVERKKVSREILERPYQNVFRKNILTAFNSTCLITKVNIENVLEASHIKDVKYNGNDLVENGLCLRADIHQLFDSRHLKIVPNGQIILSEQAAARTNYESLPREIEIPAFINRDLLDWRLNYT